MIELATQVRNEVERAAKRFRRLSESDVTRDRGSGRWVRKEILGHLIDSATNNHQRFVRAQLAGPLIWPGYDQEAWVPLHHYRDRPWTDLVNLWEALNHHLAVVIEFMPEAKLQTRCTIGNHEPATLEWWMRDYLRHLKHHLEQLESD